jgi:hypothetical protein
VAAYGKPFIIFFMAEAFGFFTEVRQKAYPKSVPPIKSLCQLILADIERLPRRNQMDRFQGQEVLIAKAISSTS